MSQSNRDYLRRAFMVLAGVAVGTVVMAGAVDAANRNKQGSSPTPFDKVVEKYFQKWDQNGDHKLSFDEVAKLVRSPHVKGEEAAALASIYFYQKGVVVLNKGSGAVELNSLLGRVAGGGISKDFDFAGSYCGALDQMRTNSHRLFEGNGPRLSRVRQGSVGDCSLVASVGALVNRSPVEIRDMFHPQADGSCEVQFPGAAGVKVPRITDAEIALTSTCEHDGLWMNVLQEAYGMVLAKLEHKRASATEAINQTSFGLYIGQSLEVLTGCKAGDAPTGLKETRNGRSGRKLEDQLRDVLASATKERRLMVGGTWIGDVLPHTPGISGGHAWAVLSYNRARDMLRLWNPYGDDFSITGPPGLANGYPRKAGYCDMAFGVFVKNFCDVNYQTPESLPEAAGKSAKTPAVKPTEDEKALTPAEKMAVADVLLGTWTVEKTNGYRGTWTFTSDGKVTNSDRRPLTTRWTIESGAVMIRWNGKLWESLTLPLDPTGSTGPCWQGTAKAVKVE